ncbi:MAG TPA: membrane protein insertion efficiency factor YidD [Verrucomicrobiae bacterium]|nr:membrane protein insertion efficiency factor YidD [Verrucomicrobiae bacterium]
MKNIEHPMVMRFRHHWMFGIRCSVFDVPKSVLIFAIRIYRLLISPALAFLFGPATGCRFTPTCSQYAVDAIRSRGAVAGIWLAAKRVCRCHPWGNCGHDPVAKAENKLVLGDSL